MVCIWVLDTSYSPLNIHIYHLIGWSAVDQAKISSLLWYDLCRSRNKLSIFVPKTSPSLRSLPSNFFLWLFFFSRLCDRASLFFDEKWKRRTKQRKKRKGRERKKYYFNPTGIILIEKKALELLQYSPCQVSYFFKKKKKKEIERLLEVDFYVFALQIRF